MANNLITANVSTKVLKFKPGGSPATFEVTVVNDSEQQASFQLEVIAAGADAEHDFRWYRISPAVSAKQPPGDSTKFYVSLTDTPVPGFVGIMNLTVRVFSLELRDEDRAVLRLIVQEGAASKPLKLDLPVRKFQVTPGEVVEVPVRLNNPNQQAIDVALRFLGVEPSWLVDGVEQRFQLDPGEQTEVIFSCLPPSRLTQAPSQVYPFTIEATHHNAPPVTEEGTLEVVPSGFVEFSCTPEQQTIPAKGGWLPTLQADPATYEIRFDNQSNLCSSARLELQGKAIAKYTLEVIPPEVDLKPGETNKAELVVSKGRPLWGMPQKLLLEVKGVLLDPRVDLQNDTQKVELRVLPVFPLWLQVAGGLLALLLLWFFFWERSQGHTDHVTSVRFNGIADRVISSSTDQTIRSWRVKENHLESTGVFAEPGKAVRVIRYKPVNNDQVAVGLENGEIQLWDVLGEPKKPVKSFSYQKDDRVLGLEFTKDSRFLFSSHGSGLVLMWDLESNSGDNPLANNQPLLRPRFNFAVYSLAIVGKRDDNNLVIGGRFNQLGVWNWASSKAPRRLPYREGSKDDYIQSIAVAPDKPNLMATADTQGYITLWDMSECLVKDVKCQVLDEWSRGHRGKPVRAVNFSKDGCYLASVGDDGREMLWPLTSEGRRDSKLRSGRKVAEFSDRLNDVALTTDGENILLVSGGDDHRVRLHRVEGSNTNCK